MAGSYPDSPSWRIAYDEDGTQGFYIDASNVVTAMEAGALVAMNNDNAADGHATGMTSTMKACLIFPCLMDIDACYLQMATGGGGGGYFRAGTIETSVNTTNGVDGTWVSQTVGSAIAGTGKPAARNNIVSGTWGGIRAVRWNGADVGGGRFAATLHLYGEPTAGQTLDRLVLWHPTLNQRVGAAYFDWGDVPRGSSGDKTFRVKNLSPTLTATSPRISLETLDDGSPSVPGYHTLSKGAGFASQQNLANIGPGAISAETCTLRRTTPSNAQLSLWDLRIQAEATTWV